MIITALLALIFLILVFIAFYFFWFLRNPKRNPSKEKVIVSPANGKIHKIMYTNDKSIKIQKGLLGKIKAFTDDVSKKCAIISITMTPLNVHYQRAPLDGKVVKIKYQKGKFLNAVHDSKNMQATFENENNQILIKTEIGNIKVIQIAGFIARRIISIARKNQYIKKGQTIGLIKLGSQVTLILPKNKIRITAKEGQTVIDGETVLAEIR